MSRQPRTADFRRPTRAFSSALAKRATHCSRGQAASTWSQDSGRSGESPRSRQRTRRRTARPWPSIPSVWRPCTSGASRAQSPRGARRRPSASRALVMISGSWVARSAPSQLSSASTGRSWASKPRARATKPAPCWFPRSCRQARRLASAWGSSGVAGARSRSRHPGQSMPGGGAAWAEPWSRRARTMVEPIKGCLQPDPVGWSPVDGRTPCRRRPPRLSCAGVAEGNIRGVDQSSPLECRMSGSHGGSNVG